MLLNGDSAKGWEWYCIRIGEGIGVCWSVKKEDQITRRINSKCLVKSVRNWCFDQGKWEAY